MTDLAVIMLVYQKDRIEFVRQSVESILNQTFSRFHYYLIFDGPVSSDIDEYVRSLPDDRIRFFSLEKNGGLASALNYLLEKVLSNPDYKLIARMDADDISMPSRFEKQRNFLLEHTGISVLGCWYEEIDELDNHLSYRQLPVDHEALRKRYFTRTPFAHPSVMFRRELIEKAGFYPTDTILMEDNVLWGRALKSKLMFGNIPEYLLRFRIEKSTFKRRSGFKYGLHYISRRNGINRSLNYPLYSYLITCLIGIIKMAPDFVFRYIHKLINKY